LEEEKESLGCHPCDKEEGAGRDSEHQERAEMVIFRLPAQWAFFFHRAWKMFAHSFAICAGDEITNFQPAFILLDRSRDGDRIPSQGL
jgi:hypothetical protein